MNAPMKRRLKRGNTLMAEDAGEVAMNAPMKRRLKPVNEFCADIFTPNCRNECSDEEETETQFRIHLDRPPPCVAMNAPMKRRLKQNPVLRDNDAALRRNECSDEEETETMAGRPSCLSGTKSQ